MAFSISDITARINENGLARNNKFDVTHVIPAALQGSDVVSQSLLNAGGNVSYWIEETAIPAVALMTHPHRRYGYGPKQEKPFSVGFGEFPCMVRCDMNGDLFKFYLAWSRLAVNHNFGNSISDNSSFSSQYPYEVRYLTDYAVTATLTMYRDDGQPWVRLNMRDAYPKFIIGDTVLSWGKKNEYLRFPVNFAFTDYSIDTDPSNQ